MGPFKHRKKRSTDVTVTGDLVQGAWRLAEEAGWLVELEELCGSGWKNKEEGKEERGEEDVKGELAGNFVRCSTIDLGHFTVVLANFIATFRLYSDYTLIIFD